MPKKKLNFKDTRQKISAPLAMSTKSQKKSFNLSKTPEKNIIEQMLGQDQPEKNLAKSLIRSREIPSPDRHRS